MLKEFTSDFYRVRNKDILLMIAKSVGIVILLDYFFYKSLWALILLIPMGALYFRKERKDFIEKIRHEGREEFKELLLLSSTNMRAGYSVENALLGSMEDMGNLFGTDSIMCNLLRKISHKRANNQPFEGIFLMAGKSMGIEEMVMFGQLYEIAYAGSGNLSSVMEKVADTIIENVETENEIYMSLCERQFEMKIMNLMPLMIMFYINLTNNGYFDKLYHNLPGICIMSVCLLFYAAAYYAGYKIMKIRI